jgi:hypothetical protein
MTPKQKSPNKKTKLGIHGFFYALWRCAIEWKPSPMVDYAENERVVWKYIWKNARGIFILFIIVDLALAFCFYKKIWYLGYEASQHAAGDAMLQEVNSIPKSERGKIYQKWMVDNDGDSGKLCVCGADAFKAEDYEWSVNFFENAYLYKDLPDDNCRQEYPYYAGALILLNRPNEADQQLQKMIGFIDDDIKNNKGQLRFAPSLGGIIARLNIVREKLPADKKHYMETFRDQVKNRIKEVENH